MNTKTLLYSIVGIFAVSAGAYFVVSPIAKDALYDPALEQIGMTQEDTAMVATTTTDTNAQAESPQASSVKPTASPSVTAPSQPAPSTPSQSVGPTPTPAEPVVTPGYTSAEVAQHSSESSCWSIVNGNVYDLTSYIPRHPGGKREILGICGRDGSFAFEDQHGGDSKPEKILAGYKIGPLK